MVLICQQAKQVQIRIALKHLIAYLERAYQLDSGSVPTMINLGGAYVMAGRHKEAIPLLEAARDAEPHNANIQINLGAAYLGNPLLSTHEEQMQAIAAFEKALSERRRRH